MRRGSEKEYGTKVNHHTLLEKGEARRVKERRRREEGTCVRGEGAEVSYWFSEGWRGKEGMGVE